MKKNILSFLSFLAFSIFGLFLAGCEFNPEKEKAVPVFQGMTYQIEESSQVILRSGLYYASKNAYVILSVNFLNPDDQAILSLEINEVEYLSYQFQTGSTNQKVLVLVDSGNQVGTVTYSVSNIRYLNKDIASDVVMTGMDTLTLQVIGNNIPSATILVSDLSYTMANILATVNDTDEAIDPSTLRMVLKENGLVKKTQMLELGENAVSLEDLVPNKSYGLEVIATYSLFDDLDQIDVVLANASFQTPQKSITVSNITFSSASFVLVEGGELTLSSVELVREGAVVQSLDDLGVRVFGGLLGNNQYQIRATYVKAPDFTYVVTSSFKTIARNVPTVEFKSVVAYDTYATFAIDVIDRQLTGSLSKLEVFRGTNLVQTLPDLSRRIIEDLEAFYEYRLVATYSYDLGDGLGGRTLTTQTTFTTVETPPVVTPGVDLEQTILDLVERVAPAVIGVSNFGPADENNSTIQSLGSGVIYKRIANLIDPLQGETPDNILNYTYYVFTNKHVIESEETPEIPNKIKVYLEPERSTIDAIVMGKDARVDLAIVKFDHTTFIEPVVLGDSNDVLAGMFAIAIGNPSGYNYYGSVTFGIISHPKRYVPEDYDGDGIIDFNAEYVQHDVAINPGNSGGGLFNLRGELIGINTMKFVDSKIDNMGFAVPINVLKLLTFSYLEEGIEPPRARLGITVTAVATLTPERIIADGLIPVPEEITYGLYIITVSENTTIGDSEIKAHDILMKFDGKEIHTTIDLTEELSNVVKYGVGTNVEITYYSRTEETIKTIFVTLKP